MSSPRDGSSDEDDAPASDGPPSGSDQPTERDARGEEPPGDVREEGPPDESDLARDSNAGPDSGRESATGSDSDSGSAPAPQYPNGGEETGADWGPVALVRRFRTSEHGAVVFVREMLSSAAIVVAIGLVLFAVSGVWPPMVAIESGSMQPHMHKGDLVFIMEEGRLAPGTAHGDTGVVTAAAGTEAGYRKFGGYGDVIVYKPDGRSYETPVIHRAMFWVEEGENWYDEADAEYLLADSCEELSTCPASNSGFITKGDNNGYYDQSNQMGISDPVKPRWIRGTAEVRVPWLGWIRLKFSGAASLAPGLGYSSAVAGSPITA